MIQLNEPDYPRLWNAGQVREFAKQFHRQHGVRAFCYLDDRAARAFADAFVLDVISVNNRESLPVGAIIQLRLDLREALLLKGE